MTAEVPVVERLDVDNYATWETRMRFLLISKGLWSAIQDNERVNPETDQKALALIGLYVKEHHLPLLKRCNTAREAWQQLAAVYQAKSNARKLQLKKELAQLKMSPGEPLTKFAARANDIQDQLRAAGHEISDQEVAWAVLAGLPAHYDMMVTVLTATETDMSVENILPKLLHVEQQQPFERPDEKALYSKSHGGNGRRNHGNSSGGQHNGNAPRGGQHGADTRTCFYCGKTGHIKRDCNKRIEDAAQRPGRGGQLMNHFSGIAL
jgi:hypothetical protein